MEAKNNCICIFIFPEEISVLQNSSKSIQFIINGQLQNFHFFVWICNPRLLQLQYAWETTHIIEA